MPRLAQTGLLRTLALTLALAAHAALAADPSASRNAPDQSPRWYVVMFVVDGCSFCQMLRERVFAPMLASGEMPQANFYEVNMTHKDEWFFFDPMQTYLQKRALYKRYELGLFPTTVILDERANLLHEPLVGITTPRFFQALLQQALSRLDEKP